MNNLDHLVNRRAFVFLQIISVGILIDNHFHLDKPAGNKTFQSHYLGKSIIYLSIHA